MTGHKAQKGAQSMSTEQHNPTQRPKATQIVKDKPLATASEFDNLERTYTQAEVDELLAKATSKPLEIRTRFIPEWQTPNINQGRLIEAMRASMRLSDPAMVSRLNDPKTEIEFVGWYDLTPHLYGEIDTTPSPQPSQAAPGFPRRAEFVIRVTTKDRKARMVAYFGPAQAAMIRELPYHSHEHGHAYRLHKEPHEGRKLAFSDAEEPAKRVDIRANPQERASSEPWEGGRYNGARPGGPSKAVHSRETVSVPATADGVDD